ncbi:MAG: hypothetical protein JST19_09285 [Bacteroidetes bacterium]|nr:hypothetical protein [Bacteroidota bacterium]
MRNDKLVPGMILVMIGAAFLLHNFGYLHFHWENFAFLWPIFIVIGGVNLVLAGNRSAWATILKAAVIIGGFALILFGDFSGTRYRWWPHWSYNYHSDNNDDNSDDNDDMGSGKSVRVSGNSQFSEPFQAGIKVARLNISGGATTFRLNDTTNQLFAAETRSFHGKYQFDKHQEDSVYVMDFHMKENHVWNWNDDGGDKNSVLMSLNTRPEWEMHIDAGATDLDFDLSKYKMRDVVLKGGAGQFVLKMGEPLTNSNITVETGASDVTVNIPQDAAYNIETSSGLSSTDYPSGYIKKDDGHYESPNFDAARTKYYIHISGGVSDFKVHTY